MTVKAKDAKQVLYDEVSANFETFLRGRRISRLLLVQADVSASKMDSGSAKSCGH